MHSVGDKIWRKSFEVYGTDSPVGEVWQLNFYYGHVFPPNIVIGTSLYWFEAGQKLVHRDWSTLLTMDNAPLVT